MATAYTWMVRLSEAEVRGPFDRSAMLRLVGKGEIPPRALVSRVGELESLPLRDHPDFQACFTPGTVEWKVVSEFQQKHANARKTARTSALRRSATLFALVAIAAGAPYVVARQHLTMPDAWLQSVSSVAARVTRSPGPTATTLPGDALIRSLAARWAGTPAAPDDLAHAQALLWHGSLRDAQAAVEVLERVVVRTPDDAEAVGALTEAYARTWDGRGDSGHAMLDLVDRADALAPQSPAARRARAAAAIASGNLAIAERATQPCGASTDELGCQVLYARAVKDGALLASLDAVHPDYGWIAILHADALLDAMHPADALVVARRLTSQMKDDGHAWTVRARAAAGVGRWDEAVQALDRALAIAPEQVDVLMLRARIHLMVKNDPVEAQTDLERIMRAPGFDLFQARVQVWCLASVAHLARGDAGGALVLAEKALEVNPNDPTALIYAAKALGLLDRRPEAEQRIQALKSQALRGRMGAQIYGWAANVLLDLDKKNAAMETLAMAKEEAAEWPEMFLEGARLEFAMGNGDGAVNDILALGQLDLESWKGESPLVDVWYPERDWSDVETALSDEVSRQLKYGKDTRSVVGILAMVTDRPTAQTLLERAVERDQIAIEERAVYAHGALAQLYVAHGQDSAAMKHIDRVLAQDSRRPLFHALKGLALSHLNDGDGAMKSFERAGEPAKNLDGPQRWRGEALARLHQDDDAIAQLELVTTRWPEDIAAQQLLLGLLEQKK